MNKEELEKLKQTVNYFGHWYDVIGEERVSILEKSIEYIAELEKENAELKVENAFCEKACEGTTMMYEQLTKAKELLNKWVELFKPKGSNIPSTPIQIATEQFLSEVEK